jgi:hypothetical protein
MERAIWLYLNKYYKEDLELLYGIGSYVEINYITECINKKIYIISSKLFVSDIKLYESAGEHGLNYLFEVAWGELCLDEYKFLLHISFDLTHSDNSSIIS